MDALSAAEGGDPRAQAGREAVEEQQAETADEALDEQKEGKERLLGQLDREGYREDDDDACNH
jgi:hypothetical protein